MENVDLSKYGIVGNFEIVHNPSYEQLFQDEMNPANEGFEKGYLTDTGAVAVNTGKFTGRSPKDKYIVKDAITENRQAIEMSQIYSNILNGTMDAYASIISNNLNGVMKFLTSVTIILAVPTMISSFWGMNVNLPFQNSKLGFMIMIIVSVLMTLIVTWWLNRKDMLK